MERASVAETSAVRLIATSTPAQKMQRFRAIDRGESVCKFDRPGHRFATPDFRAAKPAT
jgi:hypothetical protein